MTKMKKRRLKDVLPELTIDTVTKGIKAKRPWVTTSVLARQEKVTVATIFNWIRSKKIEGCVLHGRILVRNKKESAISYP